ncbi:MAG: hypothetical protein JW818_06540 [Pirellulales bacterium]|nr:hypothetical protein [Pirellulales bacterium]
MSVPADRRPTSEAEGGGCSCGPKGCPDMSRRRFIQVAGASAAALSVATQSPPAVAGPFDKKRLKGHFVPADKKLDSAWIKRLYAKGEPTVYRGKDLETIALPIGGICAGHVYLAGDGRLMHWNILNQRDFSGWGRNNYEGHYTPKSPVKQGFAIRVTSGGKTITRALDCNDFPDVTFRGEYPIGTVEYPDPKLPVAVKLDAYSPFIPLDAEQSAMPATVMEFTVKNTSDAPVDVTLAGWLQNVVSALSSGQLIGRRQNQVVQRDGVTMVVGRTVGSKRPKAVRPPRVLADFEGDDYGDWKVEGEAFGAGPAKGTLPHQQKVRGQRGKGLVNSFLGGDGPTGTLTSPEFTIDRPYLSFLMGGGLYGPRTCVRLLIDGKQVYMTIGHNDETLRWTTWDLRKLQGKKATFQIVDNRSDQWGHVLVDQVELCDVPRAARKGMLEDQEDFGTMALAVLSDKSTSGKGGKPLSCASLPSGEPAKVLFADGGLAASAEADRPVTEEMVGAVGEAFTLAPGQEVRIPFVVAWSFPKRSDRGKSNFYAHQFPTAAKVVDYLNANFDELRGNTWLWHDTWYDSTLPHWLLDRLFSTTGNLATGTCYWWGNGRFWAWEGVGCCPGTCGHVWNYAQTLGRLFPRLERSAREMQDFDAGFIKETGEIHFRGESNNFWAGDAQAGTILKAYREHQASGDDTFLRRNWPRIRKAMEFLIKEDRDENGVLEGMQHNTYDLNYYGPNTMVGSLYLGALRAAEEMATLMGDDAFAKRCRTLFERGSKWSVDNLFNGEFFIQKVDLEKHPKFQYAGGCLSDQLFGQTWAHQLGLGYVYPKDKVRKTLESIWKYNWAPDVGPQNKHFHPGRWFAKPGEAGLITCTWPNDDRIPDAMHYRDEVWTGIEYQVASNMANEGMVTEALAICRGIHERYHPSDRNPWNEVECGDHYARALASYGVFLALCGFENDGPKAHLGFAPRITPDAFRAAFTTPDGWGTFSQKRSGNTQTERIEVKWGKTPLKTLAFQLPEGKTAGNVTVLLDGKTVTNTSKSSKDGRVEVTLSNPITVQRGQTLEVRLAS